MAQYLPQKVEQVVFCRMSPLQVRGGPLVPPGAAAGATTALLAAACAQNASARSSRAARQVDLWAVCPGWLNFQVKLYEHFYASQPVQRLLRGGRAAANAAAAAAASQAGAGGDGDSQLAGGAGATQMEQDDDGGGGGGGGAEGGGRGRGRKGRGGGRGGGGGGGRKGGRGGGPQEPELAVLAAITAVKKLCCHPDLVRACTLGVQSGRLQCPLPAAEPRCWAAQGRGDPCGARGTDPHPHPSHARAYARRSTTWWRRPRRALALGRAAAPARASAAARSGRAAAAAAVGRARGPAAAAAAASSRALRAACTCSATPPSTRPTRQGSATPSTRAR